MTVELRGFWIYVACDDCGNADETQIRHIGDWFEVETIEAVYECLMCGEVIKGSFRRAEWYQDHEPIGVSTVTGGKRGQTRDD